MEFEMYEAVKRLARIVTKVANFLQAQHPELLRTMEKMSLFDGSEDGLDPGSEEGSSSAFFNLDDALNLNAEHKPATRREDQREGKSERMATGSAASPTKKETTMSAEEILKNKGDRTKFQNDSTFSKFPSGNQSDEQDENISKSTLEKHATLHLSDEDSRKLLLLASALESSDTSKKMSDCKLQKHLFDSAKQLKLKELKYDSNPCVRWCLFHSFYNQLVSVLISVESFDRVSLDDYEVHPCEDPNGVLNKALFRLLLTYINTHFKMIIQRKETNGFGDKSVLALQA